MIQICNFVCKNSVYVYFYTFVEKNWWDFHPYLCNPWLMERHWVACRFRERTLSTTKMEMHIFQPPSGLMVHGGRPGRWSQTTSLKMRFLFTRARAGSPFLDFLQVLVGNVCPQKWYSCMQVQLNTCLLGLVLKVGQCTVHWTSSLISTKGWQKRATVMSVLALC